eukprot:m51a1_g12043 putative xylem cysteine proteinase 1-like isoform x1 (608) ;mRNA; f:354-5574
MRHTHILLAALWLVPTSQDVARFGEWAHKHGKVYTTNEHSHRLGVFLHNEQIVAQLNQRHQGRTTFAMNHFGDLTAHEFLSLMAGSRPLPPDVAAYSVPNETTQNNYCRAAGWIQLPKGVEGWKLKNAVAQQPVDVVLNAEPDAFKFYKSGILQSDCPEGTGHEVLIVGYGVDNGVPYWIVRNSWGLDWGEQGYIRLVSGSKYKALSRLAPYACRTDPDGITLYFFSDSHSRHDNVRTAQDPDAGTNMTGALQAAFYEHSAAPARRTTTMLVINDGRLTTRQDISRFGEWARQHGKVYTANEHSRRLGIFLGNEQIVAQLNQRHQGSATFAMNHFGDLAAPEFLSLMTGSRVPAHIAAPSFPNETVHEARHVSGRNVVAAPDSVDWRMEGAVNQVRNQGGCGSCYAFAATAAIEGSCKIQTGSLWELSEQNVVDCSGNSGCGGGLGTNWESSTGMNRAAEYPYRAQQGTCSQTQNNYCRAAGWIQLPRGVEGWKLKNAVAQQPVHVVVNAAPDAFKFYKSGILQSDCPEGTGHEVVIVGYGMDNGVAYWLVRNSWGTGWGEQGYIRLLRTDAAGSVAFDGQPAGEGGVMRAIRVAAGRRSGWRGTRT